MAEKVTPCLWFDGAAEAAVDRYVSLIPDSRVVRVHRAPAETPSGPAGMALTVEFVLGGGNVVEVGYFHTGEAGHFTVDLVRFAHDDLAALLADALG